MRILGLFLVLCVLIARVLFYTLFVNFSEHWKYTRRTLDHHILTPSELSQMSELCIDKPGFIYSAAVGTKSTIVIMNCTIVLEGVDKCLKSKGLLAQGNGIYKENDLEVKMTTNQG
jgi:hypothetical protein